VHAQKYTHFTLSRTWRYNT